MDLNYLTVDTYSSASFDKLDKDQLWAGGRGLLVNNVYQWEPEPIEPWMDDASCVGHDPNTFEFDHRDYKKVAIALAVCESCPVKQECFDSSTKEDRRNTVRGGVRPGIFYSGNHSKDECLKGHSEWGIRTIDGKQSRYCKACKRDRNTVYNKTVRGRMSA